MRPARVGSLVGIAPVDGREHFGLSGGGGHKGGAGGGGREGAGDGVAGGVVAGWGGGGKAVGDASLAMRLH
eukprot:740338-Prorocentrum_minimum.AAC.1